jgi:tripartite-type tricarboxylate transporter receptor subunit TctC
LILGWDSQLPAHDRLVGLSSRILLVLISGCTTALAEEAADASHYPDRAIRYIVPYPPGAFNDTLARIVSQRLQEAWGVSVVVDNRDRSGGEGTGDGYTLLGVAFPFGANPNIYKKPPYDTVKDFEPVIFSPVRRRICSS